MFPGWNTLAGRAAKSRLTRAEEQRRSLCAQGLPGMRSLLEGLMDPRLLTPADGGPGSRRRHFDTATTFHAFLLLEEVRPIVLFPYSSTPQRSDQLSPGPRKRSVQSSPVFTPTLPQSPRPRLALVANVVATAATGPRKRSVQSSSVFTPTLPQSPRPRPALVANVVATAATGPRKRSVQSSSVFTPTLPQSPRPRPALVANVVATAATGPRKRSVQSSSVFTPTLPQSPRPPAPRRLPMSSPPPPPQYSAQYSKRSVR
jgi:hypothetical protein